MWNDNVDGFQVDQDEFLCHALMSTVMNSEFCTGRISWTLEELWAYAGGLCSVDGRCSCWTFQQHKTLNYFYREKQSSIKASTNSFSVYYVKFYIFIQTLLWSAISGICNATTLQTTYMPSASHQNDKQARLLQLWELQLSNGHQNLWSNRGTHRYTKTTKCVAKKMLILGI